MLNRALLKLHYMREHPVLNSWSSVYLGFGKIQEEGQSAGNLIKGSSETTCEAVNINDEFKWWFIGFTEGDGSFIVNKSGYLEFKVTQSSIDAQILFYIKKELGFGSVSVQDKVNKTHHYRIRDRKNINKLIQIFNGNIVTNYKLNQFKIWVNAFNKIYKTNIQCIENKHELTLNNWWLSGFTDAEGCFTSSTSISKSTGKAITTVRYVISQKDDIEFNKNLADLINGYVTHVKSYNGYNTVVNFGKLNKILLYLKSYPLKTKKFISYKRWLKIYDLVKDKKHLTYEGRIIIKFLSKLIN
nr:LAGLIDADG endonuclease [Cordyceps tenuipes]